MENFCDLHVHSNYSDGTFTPTQIIAMAKDLGLSAIALTDHNTSDGLCEFMNAAKKENVTAVAGVEFSADFKGIELHILGLFIPQEHFLTVTKLMAESQRRKDMSNRELIASLCRAGIVLDYDEIKAKTPNGQVNRAHIAAALMQKGYTSSVKEGFEKYLSPDGEHYKRPARMSAAEIIDFILSIGALPVLAHPLVTLDKKGLLDFLGSPQSKGLCGMECYYSAYDDATTKTALDIAKAHGLICSGGSDFHGTAKPDIKLAFGKGELRVPFECYTELKEALNLKQS